MEPDQNSKDHHLDCFPTYKDGDVKIIVTASRQYTLHSNVLKANSSVLRELLDSVEPAPLTPTAIKSGATIRYKLVLVKIEDGQMDLGYVLQIVALDINGRHKDGTPPGVSFDFEQSKFEAAALDSYHAVLGAFYNVPIQIGDAHEESISGLLSRSLAITTVAEYLDCVRIITTPIDSCLQATGQSLYHTISSNPTGWLSFAHRVRSKAIFREALIHAAGQFNTPSVQCAIRRGHMADEVVEVLERKGTAIIEGVKMAERHLASYYPTVIMREKTVGRADRDNIGRANYGNDIMMWIALVVFRHWCADAMAADQTHHAPDMGYGFIKAVMDGGNAYLSRQLMQSQFHQRFPMSPKGMACVEHRLSEIKQNVKQWAVNLLQNNAHLDIQRFPVKYFTNTKVHNADYPWENIPQRVSEEYVGIDLAGNVDYDPMTEVGTGNDGFSQRDDSPMLNGFRGVEEDGIADADGEEVSEDD